MTDKSEWEELKEAFKSDFKKLGNHPNLEGIKSSPIWKSLKVAGKEIKEKYDSHQLTKYRYTASTVYSLAKLAKGICIKSDIEFDYISSHHIFHSFIYECITVDDQKSLNDLKALTKPSDYTFPHSDKNIPINVELYWFKQCDKKNEYEYLLQKVKEYWEMSGRRIHRDAWFWAQDFCHVGPKAKAARDAGIVVFNQEQQVMVEVFQKISEYPNSTF